VGEACRSVWVDNCALHIPSYLCQVHNHPLHFLLRTRTSTIKIKTNVTTANISLTSMLKIYGVRPGSRHDCAIPAEGTTVDVIRAAVTPGGGHLRLLELVCVQPVPERVYTGDVFRSLGLASVPGSRRASSERANPPRATRTAIRASAMIKASFPGFIVLFSRWHCFGRQTSRLPMAGLRRPQEAVIHTVRVTVESRDCTSFVVALREGAIEGTRGRASVGSLECREGTVGIT
jgi:hypothetical protein